MTKRYDYICKKCWYSWRTEKVYYVCPKCRAGKNDLDVKSEVYYEL